MGRTISQVEENFWIQLLEEFISQLNQLNES